MLKDIDSQIDAIGTTTTFTNNNEEDQHTTGDQTEEPEPSEDDSSEDDSSDDDSNEEPAMDTAAEVVSTMADLGAGSPVKVDEAAAADSAPVDPPDDYASKKKKDYDKRTVELMRRGYSPEDIHELIPVFRVIGASQRTLPLHEHATSSEMIAYFDSRKDEQIEQDMLKGIRNDGGTLGPVKRYEQLMAKHGSAQAAQLIDKHVRRRIRAIRILATATMNELRRRRAITEGIDPLDITYLKVRGQR